MPCEGDFIHMLLLTQAKCQYSGFIALNYPILSELLRY
jgi:hypothetical protein